MQLDAVGFALHKLGGRASVGHIAASTGLAHTEVVVRLQRLAAVGVVHPDGDEWRLSAAMSRVSASATP